MVELELLVLLYQERFQEEQVELVALFPAKVWLEILVY
jgi:hypothetical protein